MTANANELIDVLEASVARLRALTEGLDADQLRAPAYPSKWTVADVLSHLGSAAEVMRLGLDGSRGVENLPDDFVQPIWDTWNAKSPEAQRDDALLADRELMDRIASLTAAEREKVRLDFGPVQLGLAGFVGVRINEHALHAWDIAVTFDPTATVPSDAAAAIIDNLELIVQFAGKPTGTVRDLHIRTVDPVRDLTLALTADAVTLTPCSDQHAPDLELPAEAFDRLVYGRLDPDHTPTNVSSPPLAELRQVFPGL